MRTTIELDENLIREAMAASGAETMKEAVSLGLQELVDRQRRLAALFRHKGAHPEFEAPDRRKVGRSKS